MKVGFNVLNFKVGECVGVGYCVMLCLYCDFCKEGMDSMCVNLVIRVFNVVDVDGIII